MPYSPPSGSGLLATAAFNFAVGTMRLLWRIEVEGLEHVPREGPGLLVGNHPSYIDPAAVYALVSPTRRVHFMAWDRLWIVPGVRWYLDEFDAFPVSLERADSDAFRKADALLKEGSLVGIFPEGGRSFSAGFHPTKRGAARLALRNGATIVPMALLGSRAAWPRGREPRPGRVRIVLLPPMEPPAPARGKAARAEQEREVMLEIHRVISEVLVARGELAGPVPPVPAELLA